MDLLTHGDAECFGQAAMDSTKGKFSDDATW
jgi:hypothetical protein